MVLADSDEDSVADDSDFPEEIVSNAWNNAMFFGDAPGPTLQEYFRLGVFNISNLPTRADDGKNGALFNDIIENDIDALLMQEVGLKWCMIPERES